jgi:hypothetical protein
MPEPRRPVAPVNHPWRFSLRELLLAMTAVGALVALAVKSYPSSPTPFFHQFNPEVELRAVFQELGVKLGSGGGGSGGSWGGGSGRKRWDFASHQTDRPLGQIGYEYSKRVEAALQRHGCKVTGRHWDGDIRLRSLTGFAFSYRRGATQGEFVAEFMDLPDGHFRVHTFCVEITRR